MFFIDGFTSRMKSQSMAWLLSGSAHVYWIWDLESEVHSIWAAFKHARAMFFSKLGGAGNSFRSGSKISTVFSHIWIIAINNDLLDGNVALTCWRLTDKEQVSPKERWLTSRPPHLNTWANTIPETHQLCTSQSLSTSLGQARYLRDIIPSVHKWATLSSALTQCLSQNGD